MQASGARKRGPAILGPLLGATIACAALAQSCVHCPHDSIQQLGRVPDNSVVRLVGVVVEIDPTTGQFWLEDETGAVPLSLNSPLQSGTFLPIEKGKPQEPISSHSIAEVPAPAKSTAPTEDPTSWQFLTKLHYYFSVYVPAHVYLGETVRVDALKMGAGPRDLADPPQAASVHLSKPGRKTSHVLFPATMDSPTETQVPRPASDDERISITSARPGAKLKAVRIEHVISPWLPVTATCIVWILVLHRQSSRRKTALATSADALHAMRVLSTTVQAVTRDGNFDTEIPVQGEPAVTPLIIAFNAMLAEMQARDRGRKAAESRLRNLALMDDLTGLPNRRLLSDRLAQSLSRARRDRRIVALVRINLDGFKVVNDSFGHATGDALLAQVALRLKQRFRESDTLARIGGDEFAIVLDQIYERGDAISAAGALLELIGQPFELAGKQVRVTASIGISFFPEAQEQGQLLQQADCAMYAAKRNGKNRIVQYDDKLGSAAQERLNLEGELQHAIARGEISIHYQPEFDLATNSVVRFEALARWNHPRLGQISPVNFIPVAEESGLILPLGMYVMERACMEALRWQELVCRRIQVAVNVSTLQFARDSFFEEVASVLHRTGLHPSLLQVELTESATVAGVERASEMIRRLNRMGVSVAVDDFGTGYSCLSYLPKLPFDVLKLDRSFVKDLVERRETQTFVQSILDLAHNLKMTVIVEGVETREQLGLAKSLGADEAQGFLLGRPSADPLIFLGEEVTCHSKISAS